MEDDQAALAFLSDHQADLPTPEAVAALETVSGRSPPAPARARLELLRNLTAMAQIAPIRPIRNFSVPTTATHSTRL